MVIAILELLFFTNPCHVYVAITFSSLCRFFFFFPLKKKLCTFFFCLVFLYPSLTHVRFPTGNLILFLGVLSAYLFLGDLLLEPLSSGSNLDLLSRSPIQHILGSPLSLSWGSSSTLFRLDSLFPEALDSCFCLFLVMEEYIFWWFSETRVYGR